MSDLTLKDLEDIKARADAASLGPWKCEAESDHGIVFYVLEPMVASKEEAAPIAAFIEHARTDIPRLLEMVHKLVDDIKVLEYTNGQLLKRLANKQ